MPGSYDLQTLDRLFMVKEKKIGYYKHFKTRKRLESPTKQNKK